MSSPRAGPGQAALGPLPWAEHMQMAANLLPCPSSAFSGSSAPDRPGSQPLFPLYLSTSSTLLDLPLPLIPCCQPLLWSSLLMP